MEAYQQRVIDEKNELDERLEKLRSFLSQVKCIDDIELYLLKRQKRVMIEYSKILGARIYHFKVLGDKHRDMKPPNAKVHLTHA